jgi:ribonuclease T2
LKESGLKTIRRILFTVLVLVSATAAAEWTEQNKQVCDKNNAGQFKYYVLSLSWSSEFCRSHPGNRKNELQCKQKRDFIVHGLWPECGSGKPANCKSGGREDVIDKQKIYAFMPSDFLIRHEWEKHGTCSGLARSEYFQLTEEFFRKLKFPRLSGAPKADKIEALFIENNPGLDADEIYLSCTESGPKSSSKTLDEVRICLGRESREFTRCEDVKDTCQRLKKVSVTPAK